MWGALLTIQSTVAYSNQGIEQAARKPSLKDSLYLSPSYCHNKARQQPAEARSRTSSKVLMTGGYLIIFRMEGS